MDKMLCLRAYAPSGIRTPDLLIASREHEPLHMKSLNAKTDISIFINVRYLRLKLRKNKENNKKICHIFHHIFKNIPCYVMSEVSLKRFYFALFDDGLTLKTLKLVFIGFCIQTLHIHTHCFSKHGSNYEP